MITPGKHWPAIVPECTGQVEYGIRSDNYLIGRMTYENLCWPTMQQYTGCATGLWRWLVSALYI